MKKPSHKTDELFKGKLENHATKPSFDAWFGIQDQLQRRVLWSGRNIALSFFALAFTGLSFFIMQKDKAFDARAQLAGLENFAHLEMVPNQTPLLIDEALDLPSQQSGLFANVKKDISPIESMEVTLLIEADLLGQELLQETLQAGVLEGLEPLGTQIPLSQGEMGMPFLTGLETFDDNF